MRVATLGAEAPWIGEFCRRVMRQNWVEDREIDDPAQVAEALAGLVQDPDAVIAAGLAPENKLRLRANTETPRRAACSGPRPSSSVKRCFGATTGSRMPSRWRSAK